MSLKRAAVLEQLSSSSLETQIAGFKGLSSRDWDELLFDGEIATKIKQRMLEILLGVTDRERLNDVLPVVDGLKYVLPSMSASEALPFIETLLSELEPQVQTHIILHLLIRSANRDPGTVLILSDTVIRPLEETTEIVAEMLSAVDQPLSSDPGSGVPPELYGMFEDLLAAVQSSLFPRMWLVLGADHVAELQGVAETLIEKFRDERLRSVGTELLIRLFPLFGQYQWQQFSRFVLSLLQPSPSGVVEDSVFEIASIFAFADQDQNTGSLFDILSALMDLLDTNTESLGAIARLLEGQEKLDNSSISLMLNLEAQVAGSEELRGRTGGAQLIEQLDRLKKTSEPETVVQSTANPPLDRFLENAKQAGPENLETRKLAYRGLLEMIELAPKHSYFELVSDPVRLLKQHANQLRDSKKVLLRLHSDLDPNYETVYTLGLAGLEDESEVAHTSLKLLCALSTKEPRVVSTSRGLRAALEKLKQSTRLPETDISAASMHITTALLEEGYEDPSLDEFIDRKQLYTLRRSALEPQNSSVR